VPSYASNADGLHAHACGLKHLEGSIEGLQEALVTGYEMAIRVVHLDMLRNMQALRMTLGRVAVVRQ
jgi:hypothetical protein